jgi:glutathione S-transferase
MNYNNSMSYNPMVIYGGLELNPLHERMLEEANVEKLVLKGRLELEQLKKENRDLYNRLELSCPARMTLYHCGTSPDGHAIRLLCQIADIKIHLKRVFDYVTQTPSFSGNIGGQTQYPKIESPDKTFAITGSHAIMNFLVSKNKHNKISQSFIPKDVAKRALMESAINWINTAVYPLIQKAIFPILDFKCPTGSVAAKDEEKETLRAQKECLREIRKETLKPLIGYFVQKDGFVAGKELTLADLQIATKLQYLKVIEFEFYAKEMEYLERVEAACGNAWEEICAPTMEMLMSNCKKIDF